MRCSLVNILFFFISVCFAKQKQGLQILTEFKPEDCSRTAVNGDTVSVHYTGKLQNGKVFDSSVVSKREPIKFELGAGKVIQGWEKGILGMCKGEKRKLVIPPELAYGPSGVEGVIPSQETLTFETELVELETKPAARVEYNIQNILSFAMWPVLVLVVFYFLYKRVSAADEKVKSVKKSRKKKH